MLRNLNATLPSGGRILGTPFVGLLAAQIQSETATGTNGPGVLYNDGLVTGKRYRLLLDTPAGINGFVLENGALNAVVAPSSSTYSLYEDNLLVGSGISITVGTPVTPSVPTVVSGPFTNPTTRLPLPSTLIEHVLLISIATPSIILAQANLTTDSVARLTVANTALVSGTSYLLLAFNASGASVGVQRVTAA